MTEKRILIAGCGRIGQRLGRHLALAGHRVFGLRRSAMTLPENLHPVQADLLKLDALRHALPPSIDQIYYILTPSEVTDAGYKAAYVSGLSNLIEAVSAQTHPLPRIIFVSSTGVYGQSAGKWVDETSPTHPTRFSGQRLLQAEQLATNYSGEFVCVRFSGIYGPGRERLLEKVTAGSRCQSSPVLYTNRIHETDCVGVLSHVGQLSQPAACYLASDNCPVPQCELMQWLATALNAPRPIPIAGNSSGRRCNNQRLQRSGYHWIYPDFRRGYAAVINGRDAPH